MYAELFEIWKRELENIELQKIPPDFYSKIVEYLKRLKEESRMLDRRTVKANLLKNETRNVRRMLRELLQTRYKKLARKTLGGHKIAPGFLAIEEEQMQAGFLPLAETYQGFLKSILQGHEPKMNVEQLHKRVTLRILKELPAIIGADLKTYGPFDAEDVASFPAENAKILVNKSLAERIDIR